MIPLDLFEKWQSVLDERARLCLNEEEYQEYLAIPDSERLSQLNEILENPIGRFTPVNEVYFRARWSEVINEVHLGQDLTVLEIASGDADMIPQAMSRSHLQGRYITVNMNRVLSERLLVKTRDLSIEMMVIEDDAANIEHHLLSESVDIIAFQHAVNDVIQAILCDREGIDTIYADWMDTLPKMISILQREITENTLEQHVKPAFLNLLKKLSKLLKKDGVMVISHYMFQLDLDWGYPPGLWEDIIPITREWIKELPEIQEVFFNGFHPHWWMFYQKS